MMPLSVFIYCKVLEKLRGVITYRKFVSWSYRSQAFYERAYR